MATRAVGVSQRKDAIVAAPSRALRSPIAILRTLPRPPAFDERHVPRAALVRKLAQASDQPLAVISAPAGYGKTSLLAEWAASDSRPFVWIRGVDATVEAAAIKPTTFTAGAHTGRGVVFVLDDADGLDPGLLRDVTDALLAEMPSGSQLAISSRARPPLPLGRLRAARMLVELDTGDLAMSQREAATLLRRCGCALEAGSLQELLARTEGWPAALSLAAICLRAQPAGDRDARAFRGDGPAMSEYLRDTVLAEAATDEIDFLAATSPLDELSGPLCDAALRRSGSAAILRRLAGQNLLVTSAEPRGETFRLHPLLRDLLRSRLKAEEPGTAARVHRRASTWYARRHEPDLAIEHAVAARDAARAGDLIWAGILRLQALGRHEDVRRWLGRFSAEEIAAHAPLAQAATHSALMVGDMPLARLWARAAVSARPGRMTRGAQEKAVGLAVVEAADARSGEALMGDEAIRACRFEPSDSPWLPVCLLLRGVSRHLAGRPQEAKAELTEALHATSVTSPLIASLCAAQLAILAMDAEDWELALDFADWAVALLAEHDLGACPTAALSYAVAAAAHAHRGRIDEARAELVRCSDLMTGLGDFMPWYEVETRILLARAALSLTDTVRARTLLAEGSRFARRAHDTAIFTTWFDAAWGHIDAHAEAVLSGPSSLTIAELRILRFLPTHLSFREIAARLHVSSNTVKSQAHAVYRKLDASSRSEAVANASAAGLLGQ